MFLTEDLTLENGEFGHGLREFHALDSDTDYSLGYQSERGYREDSLQSAASRSRGKAARKPPSGNTETAAAVSSLKHNTELPSNNTENIH